MSILSSSMLPTLLVLLCVVILILMFGRVRRLATHVASIALRHVPGDENRDESDGAVRRWWRRRVSAISIGLVIGSAAAAVYAWWLGADRIGPATDLLVLGALAGAVVACSCVSIGRRRTMPSSAPRVAHAERASLAAFVPTWLRFAACVVASAATILLIVGAIVAASSPRFTGFSPVLPPSALLLALGLISLCGFELLGRLLVSSPSRASTRAQLVSDAVVRCLVVRDLAAATVGLGAASMALTLPDLIVNLEVPIWPGSGSLIYWAAAAAGSLALAVALVYPLWSKGPKTLGPARGRSAAHGLAEAAFR